MPKKRTLPAGAQSAADTPLPVKAVYPIGDLAKALNIPWRRLKRMLENMDVKFMRLDRSWLVPLSEIEQKVPPLFEKIAAAHRAKSALDDG